MKKRFLVFGLAVIDGRSRREVEVEQKQVKIIPFLIIFAVFGLICLGSCDRSSRYLRFTNRGQDYYEKIAAACEEIRMTTPGGLADGRKLSPADLHLPVVLKELHAEYFRVTTNRVFAGIGVGRGGYGIAWERFNGTPPRGELRTYAESLEKVLLVKPM